MDNNINMDIDECFRILELKTDATEAEVKEAYRHLAFIWHSDRIPPENSALRLRADEKMKQINDANERIMVYAQRISV